MNKIKIFPKSAKRDRRETETHGGYMRSFFPVYDLLE